MSKVTIHGQEFDLEQFPDAKSLTDILGHNFFKDLDVKERREAEISLWGEIETFNKKASKKAAKEAKTIGVDNMNPPASNVGKNEKEEKKEKEPK